MFNLIIKFSKHYENKYGGILNLKLIHRRLLLFLVVYLTGRSLELVLNFKKSDFYI